MTPMMKQYLEIKENYKDCILLFRLGDFYEMFFEDALESSKILSIALTNKSYGNGKQAPMCGIPFHSAKNYIDKLVDNNKKVAICEQLSNPKDQKGIVKRDVIRVISKSNNYDSDINNKTNNYVLAIYSEDNGIYSNSIYTLAFVDIYVGTFIVTTVFGIDSLVNEIGKMFPVEIIVRNEKIIDEIQRKIDTKNILLTVLEGSRIEFTSYLKEHLKDEYIDFVQTKEDYIYVSGFIIKYLSSMQKMSLDNLKDIEVYDTKKYVKLDYTTIKNLELLESLSGNKKNSLYGILNKTKTNMGDRYLKHLLTEPLMELSLINERLDAIEYFNENIIIRDEIIEHLRKICDLESMTSKLAYRSILPKDLIIIKNSLLEIKKLFEISKRLDINIGEIPDISNEYNLINDAILDNPNNNIKEGGIIKEGYNAQVDKYRSLKERTNEYLAELEANEKEKTDIRNLKIGYNRVYGYFFEVTNSYKDKVPKTWERKQTLVGSERYITSDLKSLEEEILEASEKLFEIEYELFCNIRTLLKTSIKKFKECCKYIMKIDFFTSMSVVAVDNNYKRPVFNTNNIIDIKNARHPVVEKISKEDFIGNDIYFSDDEKLLLITGPNMAGKSTYMRQTALIMIMAQIGMFVPADYINISMINGVFTRIGASDDLAMGKSTFMVEMSEVSNILRNADSKSLVIMDEIGRGTSTVEGLSIAFAVAVELIKMKSFCLFATHYHELIKFLEPYKEVINYCTKVLNKEDDVVFLHKVEKGSMNLSYGIYVAKLAGIDVDVINRAKEISKELYKKENVQIDEKILNMDESKSLNKNNMEVINILNKIEVNELNPLVAFNLIIDLKKILDKNI